MKLSFIVQDLVGQGMQYATAAVIREMVARGIDIEILISPVHKDKVASGGQIPFPIPDSVKWLWMPSRKARYNIWFIRKYLKKTDATAVFSTSGPYHKAHRYALIALKTRTLNVAMDHGIIGWNQGEFKEVPPFPKFSGKAIAWNWFYSRFDRVFMVNDFARRNFLRLTPWFRAEQTYTVYNPCIDEVFAEKIKHKPSHPWLIDKNCPTFVVAGACQPYKNHMQILRAAKLVRDQGIRFRIIFFGTGPLVPSYEKFIYANHLEDYVSVAGYTNNLPAEMHGADGFLLSSTWESFGIVTVEALAAGLPVISTDAIGPVEVLDRGKYGRIVPIGDVEAMAKAIADEVAYPSKRPPDESWKRFTCDKCVDRFLQGLGVTI